LSSDGKFYTCLFNGQGHDLRALLRDRATDRELTDFISGIWRARGDRYSELRAQSYKPPVKAEMSHIGG
jgi:cyclic pyranopterin phosphate synthase